MAKDIKDSVHEINLSLQKITLIQESQASDIQKHIKRTDLLEKHVTQIETMHATCPARYSTLASKTIMRWVKDLSVIVGLVVLILKTFQII